jgi:RimJ/RimL family protein N-acetyltransferase
VTWHLETERLSLRPVDASDGDALFDVLSDPLSMRFYPRPFDRGMTADWIARIQARYRRDGYGLLAVVEKGSGATIGDCGPTLQDTGHGTHVELGWHVRRDRQGRGFAVEAGAACRDHAWRALGADHLISIIRPENVASWSVARRLGFSAWRGDVRAGMAHVLWRLEASSSSDEGSARPKPAQGVRR